MASRAAGSSSTPSGNYRRDLQLKDLDEDDTCDILWVNPSNGNVRVRINEYLK